jgi:hypothetical protein
MQMSVSVRALVPLAKALCFGLLVVGINASFPGRTVLEW